MKIRSALLVAGLLAAFTAAAETQTQRYIFKANVSGLVGEAPAIYEFDSFTFDNCGQTGRVGPRLDDCLGRSNYANEEWTQDPDLYSMETRGIQRWTVPATGQYRIQAAGARGGACCSNSAAGAIVEGVFRLQAGEVIQLLVGQRGSFDTSRARGGGGGSFVVTDGNEPLLVAGGGGSRASAGRGRYQTEGRSGRGYGTNRIDYNGGSHGQGGDGGRGFGGGGGFLTSGDGSSGADSFLEGGAGGRGRGSSNFHSASGGFGGGAGGGARSSVVQGAGGGGGYSGGGGARSSRNASAPRSGGGGSFISHLALSASTGSGSYSHNSNAHEGYAGEVGSLSPSYNDGHGYIEIQRLN